MGDGVEELAVAVDDRFQHHGVGTLLLAGAIASARLRRIRRLVAWVKAENVAMRHLLTASHLAFRLAWEGSVARHELEMPLNLPVSAAA